jgi:phosphoenolpyruvate carboxykinase (ATP)
VRAALDGRLEGVATRQEPHFGLHVPTSCPGVDATRLDPRATWPDADAYDAQAARLARMFVENFAQFGDVPAHIRAAGPRST